MNAEFQTIIEQMEPLLEKLRLSPLLTLSDVQATPGKKFPKQGVYVFYENGRPIYVGRSNRMRNRIIEHGADSARHGAATFAFKLLRERLNKLPTYTPKDSREEIQKNHPGEYAMQRERVRKMKIRVIEIEDQQVQAVFEIYAILSLGTTRYNTFKTT